MRAHPKPWIVASLVLYCLTLAPAYADPITLFIAASLGSIGVSAGVALAVGALASIAVGAAVSFGVAALGSLLMKGKRPSLKAGGSFSQAASDRTTMVRSSIESHKIIYGQVRIAGTIVFVNAAPAPEGQYGYLSMVVVLAGHEVEEIGQLYIDEEAVTVDSDGFVTQSKYILGENTSHVKILKFTGSPTQTADSRIIQRNSGLWTADHRLRGLAYLYVELRYNQTIFPAGIPQFSAVVKGRKVYDPRTSTTAWSDNAALCLRDYITTGNNDPLYDFGLGAQSDEIDDASVIAASNICDELVTLKAGGTQKRYLCNGVVDTAEKPIDILKAMASSMAGTVVYTQGKFRLCPGAYTAPTITIDETWLMDEIQVVTRTPRAELFNAVKGVYVEPTKYWQPTDFPIITNATYEEQDGGHRITRDLELQYTTHVEAAQRIGKIALEKSRQGIIVTLPCNMKALQVTVWDTVRLTLDLMGWNEKIFRVLNWELNKEGGITLTVQEESSASYDWNNGEATLYDPAPDTNLPDPSIVGVPGAVTIVEELYLSNTGSGFKSQASVSWTPPDDAFTSRYVVEYKLSTETAYTLAGEYLESPALIRDLGAGLYNFRVKAVNTFGATGAYAETTREIFGITAPPSAITGFAVNVIHNNAQLTWDQAADVDVRIGGYIHLRHSPLTVGATWENSVEITNALPGNATTATVPLMAGTYLIKAVDSAGNSSINATTITSDIVNLVNLNVVVTDNQHPTFPGAKTSMVANGGILSLAGVGLFDSASGNFDSASGLFDSGNGNGYATSGTYQLDAPIDLGNVYTSRLTMTLNTATVNEGQFFDSFAQNWDDIPGLWDGGGLSGVTVTPYIRTTPDDPSGAPTWTEWRKFVGVGDITARGIDAKLEVTSPDKTLNVQISEFALSVDVPDREDRGSNVAVGTGATTITFSKPFFAVPSLGISVQNGSTGDYYAITSKTVNGFTIQVFNSSGVGVARTIDWTAKGY